ncbi:MAG TPA: hypothetical protein PLN69_06475 [bacterium]|nr:hypothetical protein [bacterium]
MKKPVAKFFIPVFLLLILACMFFFNRFFLPGANFGDDSLEHDIPQARLFVDSFRSGDLINWNPHKAFGVPFPETSFMGPFYPFAAMYFMFPADRAVSLGIAIHILLSGVFMLALLMRLRFGPGVSFLGAAAWMLSGVFQQYSADGWLSETIAAAYLPLLLLLFVAAVESGRKRRFALFTVLGICAALCVLGGKPDFAAVTLYSLVFFSIPSIRAKGVVTGLALAAVTATLLSSVVWGPLAAQAHGLPLERMGCFGYSVSDLLNFIMPSELRRGFAGRPALALAAVGFFAARGRFSNNFRLLAVLSFFLLFSYRSRIGFEPVDLLPFANQTRHVAIWHTGLILSIAALACSGAELLFKTTAARLGRNAAAILLAAVCLLQIGDLYYFNRAYHPSGFDTSPSEYFPDAPIVELLNNDNSLFRVSNELYGHEHFRANQGTYHGIDCYESRIKGVNLYQLNGSGGLSHEIMTHPPQRVMDIAGVKYIITDRELPEPVFRKLLTLDGVFRAHPALFRGKAYLYRNDGAFPRAFTIGGHSESVIRAELLDGYPGPLRETDIGDAAFSILAGYKTAETRRSANRYSVEYECVGNCFVFVGEMNNGCRRALMDGKPVTLEKPLGFFIGAFSPPGRHTLEITCRTPLRNLWLLLTAAGIAVSLVMLKWASSDES